MARPTIYHVKLTFNGKQWFSFWCTQVREAGRNISFINRQVPRLERLPTGYQIRSIPLSALTIVVDRIAYYGYPEPAPDWFALDGVTATPHVL